MSINNSRVRVLALKKAEQGDDVIVRVVEIDGQAKPDVQIKFAATVAAAHEVDGQEAPTGKAPLANGALATSFAPYQVRSFAVKLAPPQTPIAKPRSQSVSLPYNVSVATLDGVKSAGGFDAQGRALPAEMLPAGISWSGIVFKLASPASGKANAVAAQGQTVQLPPGTFKRAYLLAASSEGDQTATFRIGENPMELTIQDWSGFIGQWEDRTWNKKQEQLPPRPGAPPNAPPRVRTVLEYTGLKPGYIKRAPVAWYASHRHTAEGANEAYAYSYLFAYPMEVPVGAKTLTLPNNDKIRILAVTVSDESNEGHPAQPLYDMLKR